MTGSGGAGSTRGALALEGALDLDTVARQALAGLAAAPGVRRAGLALSEGGGRRLRFTADDRDHAGAVDWCDIDAYDDVPLTTVVRTGEPILAALDDLDRRFAVLVEGQHRSGVVALAAVPLPGTGSPMGGLILFYDRAQPFDGEQAGELADCAAEIASALLRVRAAEPRAVPLADEPAPDGAVVADTVVEGEPRAASLARQFLRRQLSSWEVDDEVTDTAVLCLSELVTNAVIHTGGSSEVRAMLAGHLLTVMVRDQGRPGLPDDAYPVDDDDPMRVYGRGLQLIDSLADRWGSQRDAQGTTVWFELASAPA